MPKILAMGKERKALSKLFSSPPARLEDEYRLSTVETAIFVALDLIFFLLFCAGGTTTHMENKSCCILGGLR